MRDVILDLRLHLIEGRGRLDAFVLDFDNMPAELGLHRIGNLPVIELERDFGEFGHHLLLGEIAEVAAFGGARIFRLFLRKRGEIRATLQLYEDRLGFVLGRDQDMAGVHLFLVLYLLDGFVIDFAFRFIGQGGFPGVLQQRFHQQSVVVEGEPVLDIGPIAQLLLLGGLRQHDHIDEIIDEVIALLLRGYRRHVAADLLLGESEVARMDIDAVGAGDHRIAVLRPRSAERRGQECNTNKHAERAANE